MVLKYRVVEALGVHENRPENGVRGLQKVHVAGGRHRDVQLIPQFHNAPVQRTHLVHGGQAALPHQEGVVPRRLDFQIIIKPGHLLQLFLTCAVHQRPIKLAGFAGAAYDNTLPIFLNQAPGNAGSPVEIM